MRRPIVGADPITFREINETYAVDSKNVYAYDKILPNADPKSFISGCSNNTGADKVNFYFKEKVVDERTFALNTSVNCEIR
ncbi:MAG: DKNYY domain-containing protein [Fusobacteriaceae bacterium]|nr:DKNYY domain-containing protein [Fusobacteriaceae bacterium]MBU9918742.1 DKNYY domain-containing protein [Fusobacteriaceae bacterium]